MILRILVEVNSTHFHPPLSNTTYHCPPLEGYFPTPKFGYLGVDCGRFGYLGVSVEPFWAILRWILSYSKALQPPPFQQYQPSPPPSQCWPPPTPSGRLLSEATQLKIFLGYLGVDLSHSKDMSMLKMHNVTRSSTRRGSYTPYSPAPPFQRS